MHSASPCCTRVLTDTLFAQMAHKMGNDTAFVLGYSTIQLNTDAHNPKLDDATRMTKKMFIANNRRSPDLACLADSFVSELYDEIANAEIKILDEDDLAAMDGGEVRFPPNPTISRGRIALLRLGPDAGVCPHPDCCR